MPPPIAVITGSSSGIGRQTALEFAKLGYCIVLHARRNVKGLQATADDLKGNGAADVLCITADIANELACRSLVDAAFNWHGYVDTWVNNAGVDVLTRETRTLSFEQKLQQLLDVDVAGTIRISRRVVARMQQQKTETIPAMINIGWDQAWLGMEDTPGQLFCTSKGAVMAFTQALAMSCQGKVRVNCVAPGWIKTAWGEQTTSAFWEQRAIAESLMKRWGTPADVASAILWLAAPGSEFVNGQTIRVNGGRRFYPSIED